MTHIEGKRDADLHDENGEHIGTAPTANGRDLERYERRITEHLAEHAWKDSLSGYLDAEQSVERPTVPQRVEEWGITLTYEGGEEAVDEDGWEHHKWKVTLHGPNGKLKTPYRRGTGHFGEPPEADDVLDDLRSEASAFYDEESFEDYCGNFELNTDSIKAKKTYKASLKTGKKLKAFLGDDRFELLMSKTEAM